MSGACPSYVVDHIVLLKPVAEIRPGNPTPCSILADEAFGLPDAASLSKTSTCRCVGAICDH
jgi:hypothetical protein